MYMYVYMNAQVYMRLGAHNADSLCLKLLPKQTPFPLPSIRARFLQATGSQQWFRFDSLRQFSPPVFIKGAAGKRDGNWTWNTVQQPPPMSCYSADTLQIRKRKNRVGALEPWPYLSPRVPCVQGLLNHTQPRSRVAMWGEWMEYRGQRAHPKWYQDMTGTSSGHRRCSAQL